MLTYVNEGNVDKIAIEILSIHTYRYEDTLKNENRRGEFTAEEDMQIVKLVQQHGAKWSLIAQELGTRTAHQCLLRCV